MVAVTENRSDAISNTGRFIIVLVALLAGIAGLYEFSKIYYMEIVRVGGGIYLVIIAALVITITATSSGGRFILTLFALVSTMLVVLAGSFHVPYGSHLPEARLCWKQG